MRFSKEAVKRRLMFVVLLLPLCAGIGYRFHNEIYAYAYWLIPSNRIPLPKTFGLYALNNNELFDMRKQGPAQNFSPSVEFISFINRVHPPDVDWGVYSISHEDTVDPSSQQEPPWLRGMNALQDFDQRTKDWQENSLSPSSLRMESEVKPVVGQPTMVRITPTTALQPGLYVIKEDVLKFFLRFYVDKYALEQEVVPRIRKAMEEKRWEDALRASEAALTLGLMDTQLQQEVDEIRVRLAVDAARESWKANETRITESALRLAASLRPNDPELIAFRNEMTRPKVAQEPNAVPPEQPRMEVLPSVKPGTKLMVVDEGPSESTFQEFRTKLTQAVEKKDAAFLLSIVAEDLVNSPGVEKGKAVFQKNWNLEDPKSEIWQYLGEILKQGGRFDSAKTVFTAPFVYTDLRAVNEGEVGVIIGTDVSVRSLPSAKSDLLTRLSNEVVLLNFNDGFSFAEREEGPYRWYMVKLPGGKSGFMSGRYLHCPLEYHVKFEKMDGQWRLVEFAHEWP